MPSEIDLQRDILTLLHQEKQLASGAIGQRLSDHAPTVVINALNGLKKADLVHSHNWAPPQDLFLLTASGERCVRTLLGENVKALEHDATIALLELAGQRPVSRVTTLPGVGPAIAAEIFWTHSRRNPHLEPQRAKATNPDNLTHVLGRLVGIPQSAMTPPASGYVITSKGREHLKSLKTQLKPA